MTVFFVPCVLSTRHFLHLENCKTFSSPLLCKYLGFHQKTCLLQFPTAAVLTASARASGLWPLLHLGASFLLLVLSEKAKLRVQDAHFTLWDSHHTCTQQRAPKKWKGTYTYHSLMFSTILSANGENRESVRTNVSVKYKVLKSFLNTRS